MLAATPIDQGIVAGIVAALAVFLVVAGTYLLRRERAFSRRLRVFIAAHVGEPAPPEDFVGARPRLSLSRRLNASFARSQTSTKLRQQLMRAGSPLHPYQFLYSRVGAALLGAVILGSLSFSLRLSDGYQLLMVVLGLGLGWMAPMLVLRSMQQRRLQAF